MTWAVRIVLISLGLLLAATTVFYYDAAPPIRVLVPLGIAAVLCHAGNRPTVERWFGVLNDRSPARQRWVSAAVFGLSVVYFAVSAYVSSRAFHPTWHDDQMHGVQVQMLAKGYLWRAAHPLAEFFETFHVFVRPVYAPIHFPGTAILNVAGVWLGLNSSVIPLLLVSLGCGLTYRVIAATTDGVSGLTAVLFVWGSGPTRMLATMMTSHNAMIALGVLCLWLFLRWRKSPTAAWSLALGATASLAGFTRPVDALAFAIPIGVGVLAEIVRHRRPGRWLPVPLMLAAGLPLAGLQLAFDKHVTGQWLYPPYQAYNDRFHPFTSYGGLRLRDPNATPPHVSDLFQKQAYYEQWMLAFANEFQSSSSLDLLWYRRVPFMLLGTLPGPSVIVFVPLGLLGLWNRRRWIVAAPPVVMLLLYTPHVYFLEHYPPIVGVGMALLALLGVGEFCRFVAPCWPAARTFVWSTVASTAVMATTPLSSLGGSPEVSSKTFRAVNYVYEQLPRRVQTPALVFCRISGRFFNFHDEPVYNTTTAWPDDAKIVLAQTLGAHNLDLVRYYDTLGQNRHVYDLDRNTLTLTSLGTVESILRAEQNRKTAAPRRGRRNNYGSQPYRPHRTIPLHGRGPTRRTSWPSSRSAGRTWKTARPGPPRRPCAAWSSLTRK